MKIIMRTREICGIGIVVESGTLTQKDALFGVFLTQATAADKQLNSHQPPNDGQRTSNSTLYSVASMERRCGRTV